jgi:hypothetical protein
LIQSLQVVVVEVQPRRVQAYLVARAVVVDIVPVLAAPAQQVKVITAVLADPVARNLLQVVVVAPEQ